MQRTVIFVVIAVLLVWGGIAINGKLDSNAKEAQRVSEAAAVKADADALARIKITDIRPGSGAAVKKGNTINVNYRGMLADGKVFDTSYGKAPFVVVIGTGSVIKGWDLGLIGMKVGGMRKLVIPPDLGYGATGYPPIIPANATLTFQVELLAVN